MTGTGVLTRLACVLLLGNAVSGCDDGAPTAPSTPATAVISIVPATTLLRVGEQVTLSTFVARIDGTSGTQPAAWASDRPSVAAVDSAGLVRALSAGLATVTAITAGSQATRALRIVPAVEGRWQGTLRVSACDGPPEPCATSIYGHPGDSPSYFRLTLGQLDDAVRGELRITTSSLIVQGLVRDTGELELTGTFEWTDTDGRLVRRTRLTEWRGRVAGDGESMTGRLRLVDEGVGQAVVTIDADVETLTRLP